MVSSLAPSTFFFNIYAVPLMPVGIITLLIGIYILLQNPRALTNISFFMVCICVIFWFSGLTLVYSSRTAETALKIYRSITFLGVSIISPCVYFFSVSWLGLYQQSRIRVWIGLTGGFIFYLTGLVSPLSFPGMYHYSFGHYPMYGPVNWAFLVFFFVYFIASFYVFIPAYLKETGSERKSQIRIIAMSFLVCYAGSFDYIPKLIYFDFYPFGFLTTLFWIIGVAYAIIRYKAMDIETVVHKTLMWLATMMIAVAPYVFLIFVTHDLFQKMSPVFTAAAFSALMILFYFYLQALRPRLDKLFQRRLSNLRSEVEKFSNDLVYLTDLRSLLQRFVRLLRRSLYVKEISVFLFDEEHNQYVPVIVKGIRHLKPIPKNQVFLLWLEKEARVAGLEKLRQNPENEKMLAEVNALFESLKSVILLPFVVGERLIGFAAMGKRMNLQSYKHDEIQFLTQLAVPVSIALSNSTQFEKVQQMSEELQKWNHELENRVDERTRELKDAQVQLIQAEKMATLGILAGGVAHEINNPLTAVLTNAQILRMTASVDDKESLEMIEEGAKRCQVIVQKLLNYSRTAAVEKPNQKMDLNRAIKNVVAMLSYQLKQENIEIYFESAELPIVSAIQNEIEQVFTNLIVNAKDAIKKKGEPKGRIEIKTFAKDGFIFARVHDNGTGIPQKIIGKIFDPFFTTKDVGEGTGLGLSVTHGIVVRSNGRIEVDSQSGKGTTFVVSFPTV